jgi:hypothetical protein
MEIERSLVFAAWTPVTRLQDVQNVLASSVDRLCFWFHFGGKQLFDSCIKREHFEHNFKVNPDAIFILLSNLCSEI